MASAVNGGVMRTTKYNKDSGEMRIIEKKLKHPPENLNAVESRKDTELIMQVLFTIHEFVKRSTRLENNLEILKAYYKVHCSNFQERIKLSELKKIEMINDSLGWRAIRDVYFEPENGRLVVEVNKESTRSVLQNVAGPVGFNRLPASNLGATRPTAERGTKRRRLEETSTDAIESGGVAKFLRGMFGDSDDEE